MIRERKRKKAKEGTAMEESTNVEFKELDRVNEHFQKDRVPVNFRSYFPF